MQQYQVNDSNSQSRLVSAVPRCHEQKEKEKVSKIHYLGLKNNTPRAEHGLFQTEAFR